MENRNLAATSSLRLTTGQRCYYWQEAAGVGPTGRKAPASPGWCMGRLFFVLLLSTSAQTLSTRPGPWTLSRLTRLHGPWPSSAHEAPRLSRHRPRLLHTSPSRNLRQHHPLPRSSVGSTGLHSAKTMRMPLLRPSTSLPGLLHLHPHRRPLHLHHRPLPPNRMCPLPIARRQGTKLSHNTRDSTSRKP